MEAGIGILPITLAPQLLQTMAEAAKANVIGRDRIAKPKMVFTTMAVATEMVNRRS